MLDAVKMTINEKYGKQTWLTEEVYYYIKMYEKYYLYLKYFMWFFHAL